MNNLEHEDEKFKNDMVLECVPVDFVPRQSPRHRCLSTGISFGRPGCKPSFGETKSVAEKKKDLSEGIEHHVNQLKTLIPLSRNRAAMDPATMKCSFKFWDETTRTTTQFDAHTKGINLYIEENYHRTHRHGESVSRDVNNLEVLHQRKPNAKG